MEWLIEQMSLHKTLKVERCEWRDVAIVSGGRLLHTVGAERRDENSPKFSTIKRFMELLMKLLTEIIIIIIINEYD